MKSLLTGIVLFLFVGFAFAQNPEAPAEEVVEQGPSLISKIADTMWGWGPVVATRDTPEGPVKDMLPLLVILLLGTGIILTFTTGAVQFKKFRSASRLLLAGAMRKDGSDKEEGDITPFQALMTSLSATVGNGNIAGVATAIALGGPGAAFWMWMTALFGMATKYGEAVLGIKYRKVAEDGSMSGGPMYYCEYGIGGKLGKTLGIIFAISGLIACLIGTGNMFQSNSMAVAVATQLTNNNIISPDSAQLAQGVVGFIVAVLVGMVILGGVKRIAAVSERLVPTMIGMYFLGALIIIFWNITDIPAAFGTILHSAMNPQAALGGAVGIGIAQAIRYGVARGILSNESGLGSAPIAHGAAKTKEPVQQGMIAMMGTFIDTIVVCTLTALVITVTGAYKQGPLFVDEGALQSIDMTMFAFNQVIPGGSYVVMIGSFLFGISTLIGWSYYGEKCLEYLAGVKSKNIYRIIFIIFLFVGSLPTAEGISELAKVGDIGNALMAVPNLIALLLLAREVGRITKDYIKRQATA
ncbi:MAG: sodium:alanine symporter family protein [Bacteroidota bacterium]